MRNTGSRRRPGALVEVYWDNPPGPQQGLTIRRIIRGHVYERIVGPHGLLGVHEAAEALGLHFLSVYRAVKEGRLAAVRKSGQILIPLHQVKRYRAKSRRGRPPGRGGAKPVTTTRVKRNPPGSRRKTTAPSLWYSDEHGESWLR